MAKRKDRVPRPPRPVQAPKKRSDPRDPRRTRLLVLSLLAALIVAGVAVGAVFAFRGGEGGGEASGPCTRETAPPMGRQHVAEPREGFEYSTTPATSGPHDPAPAVWNIYDRPVPQLKVIHNLEHGGVVVQYGSGVSPEVVSQIADWYANDPRGLIVAPLPPELEEEDRSLRNRIALTAWTHVMTCTEFDEEAFDDFLDDYRGPQGDAPEKFPLDSLQPGST